MNRLFLKIFIILIASVLPSLGVAQDAGRYATIESLKVGNETLPAGTEVEVLGIIDVDPSISPSGQLATLRYDFQIYNFDAALFYRKIGANFDYRPMRFKSGGETASICTTLMNADNRDNLGVSPADLQQYMTVKTQRGAPVTVSTTQPKYFDSYRRDNSDFCINDLQYAQTYEVTFLRGMTAVDGDERNHTLEADLSMTIQTPDRDAMVRVSAGQNILPTLETAVIPISTVNVDELEVTVHRVDLRSIANYSDVFQALDRWELNRLTSFWGEEIGRRTLELEHPKNTETAFNLNLTDLIQDVEPGLFVVTFGFEEDRSNSWEVMAAQWFMVSDISAMLFHGLESTDVFLNDFATATAMSDVAVEVIAANNRILASGTSDEQGHIRFDNGLLSGTGGFAPKYLVAQSDKAGTTVWKLEDLDKKPRAISSGMAKPHETDVYLTVSRDIFRGGDTVQVLGMARSLDLVVQPNLEMEVTLVRSDGTEVFSEFVTTNSNGAWRLDIPLKAEALLGRYTLNAKSMDDILLASQSILLDDFVPLTIEPKLTSSEAVWTANNPVNITLNAEYFSGGPAAGLDGELRVVLQKAAQAFGGDFVDFRFGIQKPTIPNSIETFDVALDESGNVEQTFTPVSTDLDVAVYEYRIVGNVFDVGGRANSVEVRVPYESHPSYIGVRSLFGDRLDEGAAPSFEIVNLDRSGNSLDLNGASYKLTKVYTRYNWYWDEGWRYRRIRTSEEGIENGAFSSKTLQLKTGLDWGRYELTAVNADGFETVYEFYVGWGAQSGPATEPETLELAVEEMSSGGSVRFEAPFDGTATVHVASSDILSSSTVQVVKGKNEVPVDLSGLPEPGGHVLITLVRPIEAGSEHLPQVAIGSEWVEHLSEDRKVSLDFDLAEKIDSSQEIAVELTLDQNEGTAVVFLVDEGIHAVTGFENVDLVDYFLGPRALGLGFQSNFGRLISQDTSLPTYRVGGGDEMAATVSAIAAEKSEFFKTYVEASPLLEVKGGKITYTFPDPGMEGRLRAVAFVATPTGVASATTSVTVQDPVSLDISLPRFVAPGDRIGGKIAVRSNDYAGEFVLRKIIGNSQDDTKIKLEAGQSFTTSLPLSTDEIGRIPVAIVAEYGSREIRREFEIVSREQSYPLTELSGLKLEEPNFLGWSRTAVPPLPLANFSSAEAIVTLSPDLGVNRAQILKALDRYPYGCIEQTSSATRGVIVNAEILGLTPSLKDKITSGVDKIVAKQKFSGAFGYWDRNGHIVDKYQPYAVETLIKALPYVNDRETVTKAISNGLEYLYRTDFADIDAQLYAYGLLAQSGYEVTSRARYALDNNLGLSRFEEDFDDYPIWATVHSFDRLSLAYWVASTLNDQVRMERLNTQMLEWVGKAKNIPFSEAQLKLKDAPVAVWNDDNITFARSKWWVMGLYWSHFLVNIDEAHQTPTTDLILEGTKNYWANRTWRSTKANSNLLTILEAQSTELSDLKVFIDGASVTLGANETIALSTAQIANGFELRHNGKQLSLVAEMVGVRSSETAIDNGYIVSKHWYDKDGKPVDLDVDPQTGGTRLSVNQGDLFTVVIEIDNSRRTSHEDLLLTDLLPSGFEIESGDLGSPKIYDENGELIELDLEVGKTPSFIQKMDDRFVAHFQSSWYTNDYAVVTYTVRAAYDTQAVIPDAHVEHMYAPEVNGRSAMGSAIVAAR